MIHYFRYNGIDSLSEDVYILNKQSYNKPQKDLSIISVPGRDGSLIIDNGGYNNVSLTLGLRMVAPQVSNDKVTSFNYAYSRISKWLKPTAEYLIYTDSYDPDYYRRAAVNSAISLTQKHYDIADFSVTFECKPYRYRWDGDEVITLDSSIANSFTITNPESYSALPIIKVFTDVEYDSQAERLHSFILNGSQYTIKQINGNCTIDSEMMNVYKGLANKNRDYQQSSFPKLVQGANTFAFVSGGNVSKIQITPRWRAI